MSTKNTTVGKAVLVARIADKQGISAKKAEEQFDAVIGAVQEALIWGENVAIQGFATIQTIDVPEKSGTFINKPWVKPAHRTLKLKVSPSFKEKL